MGIVGFWKVDVGGGLKVILRKNGVNFGYGMEGDFILVLKRDV